MLRRRGDAVTGRWGDAGKRGHGDAQNDECGMMNAEPKTRSVAAGAGKSQEKEKQVDEVQIE